MNFLLYLVSLLLFYLFFWYLLSLVTCLPGLGMVFFASRLSDKRMGATTSIIAFALTHIVSITLNTYIIAGCISSITISFIERTDSLWLYLIVGGVATIIGVGAPTGETQGLSILEGLGFYVLFMLIAFGNNVAYILGGVLFWVIILSGISGFVLWLVMKKSISGKYLKCPFCKKWLVPTGDSTKPYSCKCGAFAEQEEPHVLRFTKGSLTRRITI